MSDIKIKPVSFNSDYEDEKILLDEIESSDFNFASKTKQMWADLLNVEYLKKKSGAQPKKKDD